MQLTKSQKKYIKKNLKRLTTDQIAANIQISEKELLQYLKEYWGNEKFDKFIQKKPDILKKISPKSNFSLNEFNPKSWFTKNLVWILLLSLLVLGIYLNSLGNAFLSDDIAAIRDNENVGKVSFFLNSKAPFLALNNFVDYCIVNIFGKNPAFFRLVNVIAHLVSTLTLFAILGIFFEFPVAVFASGLFAVHPLLSEAVIWISGMPYSLGTMFCFLSLFFYINYRNSKKKPFFIISIVLFLLGILTNEKLIFFPIILSFFELIFYFKNQKKNSVLYLAPFFLIVLFWGLILIGKINQRGHDLKTVHYQTSSRENIFLKTPVAIGSYLKLLFWPEKITFYHSELNFSKTQFSLLIFLLFTYFAVSILLLIKNKILFFWSSIFFISLLPVLAPLGLGWVVAERYVYFGSIGIFVLIGFYVTKFAEIIKLKPITFVILVLLISSLSVKTFFRIKDFKDQDALWLATDKNSPSSPQNHNNLGDLYARRGQFEKAIDEFQKAINLMPNYGDAYHNIANIYVQTGKMDQAIASYQKALQFNPNLWQSHQNLGSIYYNQGKFSLAEERFKKALSINPQNPSLYTALGIILLSEGKKDEAIEQLKTALTFNSNDQQAQKALNEALGK